MNGWTEERRQRHAERIREWSPWQHSTGPRTSPGKGKSCRNAYKGSPRQHLRDIARWLARLEKD